MLGLSSSLLPYNFSASQRTPHLSHPPEVHRVVVPVSRSGLNKGGGRWVSKLRRRGHLALCWCLVVYAAADMPMDAQAERTRHMSGKEPLIESMHGDMACTSF